MNEEQKETFKEDIEKLNKTIVNDNLLAENYERWLDKRYKNYISAAQTWACRYYKSAFRRELLPAGISKKNAMLLLNYIRCESHLDLMIKSIKRYIKEK